MSAPRLVVSLCDKTGNTVRPWAEAGYECLCIDLQHSIRNPREERVGLGVIRFQWGDARQMVRHGPTAFVAAAPPCTDLAVSGARDFATKGLRLFIEALELVEACRIYCDWSEAPWMLENPVGRLSTAWRKPDYLFNPSDFGGYPGGEGDGYTKKTCLWTGGGFVMPEPRPIPVTLGSAMHLLPPSADRANLRSATPMGFARAVFQANACHHLTLEASA